MRNEFEQFITMRDLKVDCATWFSAHGCMWRRVAEAPLQQPKSRAVKKILRGYRREESEKVGQRPEKLSADIATGTAVGRSGSEPVASRSTSGASGNQRGEGEPGLRCFQ